MLLLHLDVLLYDRFKIWNQFIDKVDYFFEKIILKISRNLFKYIEGT